MGFRFFRRREDPQTTDTRDNGTTIGDPGTLSDVLLTTIMSGSSITKAQALTIPAVAANVDFISGIIASMPIKLFEKKGDKVIEVKDHRTTILNSDTGDTLDGYQLKKALITDYLLDKGGYAYIEKSKNDVTGLFYVDPEYVVIDYDFQPIYKTYSIFVGANRYRPFEFIKLLRNTTTGAWGTGIIEELNDALATAYQSQLYQLTLVKTGGNKRGFLKSDKTLGPDEMRALKLAWKRLYANNNEESVVILNNGIDFKEASSTSVELQLNESIKTLGEQINKIFHISDNFYDTFKFAIYPIIKALETALNRDMLLEVEKDTYFFEIDVKEIIKANIKERYEVYKLAKECGFMTKNEMRRAENMNDIQGLDVVDLGLGAALYDVNTHSYYTPNTDTQSELKTLEEESIIDHDNGSEE